MNRPKVKGNLVQTGPKNVGIGSLYSDPGAMFLEKPSMKRIHTTAIDEQMPSNEEMLQQRVYHESVPWSKVQSA